MGGWMDYDRMRKRNGLGDREVGYSAGMLIGDLNRMERDYLDPVYPEPPFATRPAGSDPTAVCALATGIDYEDVRRVLAFVFADPTLSPREAQTNE